jgi:hypothetical protein
MDSLLILDKSVFHGTAKDQLIEFVKCHNVVLPYSLCVECAISQSEENEYKDPIQLTNKLLELVKNGAYAGKSPDTIVKEERSRNAVIETLVDEKETQLMKEAKIYKDVDIKKVRAECETAFKPMVAFVKEWAGQYYKNICKKRLAKKFLKQMNNGYVVGRLGKWLESVDVMKNDIIDTINASGIRITFKDGWEWQMWRLCFAWGIELACKRNQSGPDFENRDISNDIYDIYYVSHLSQASGILTNDKGLAEPLAIAAFPDKDIFLSIDDVPCQYCTEKQTIVE